MFSWCIPESWFSRLCDFDCILHLRIVVGLCIHFLLYFLLWNHFVFHILLILEYSFHEFIYLYTNVDEFMKTVVLSLSYNDFCNVRGTRVCFSICRINKQGAIRVWWNLNTEECISNYPVNACGYIYFLFHFLVNIRRRSFWSSCHCANSVHASRVHEENCYFDFWWEIVYKSPWISHFYYIRTDIDVSLCSFLVVYILHV